MEIDWIWRIVKDHRMESAEPEPTAQSSVLIPLVERDGKLNILFEVRNSHIRQGGEVCFPGGRVEAGETPEEAAIRETCEELCIERENIRVFAPMFSTNRGNLRIWSYLGVITAYFDTWSAEEVERTFLVPVEELLEMEPLTAHGKLVVSLEDTFPFDLIPGGRDYPFASSARTYYFYQTKGRVIWGLTALLLYRSMCFLKERLSGI